MSPRLCAFALAPVMFLLLTPAVLFAQENAPVSAANEDTVEGLERTREAFARALVRNCKESAGEDLARLRQCLLNARIFKEVQVRRLESGALSVTFEEKQTFLPIPYALASSGGEVRVGLFLLDSNAFGQKETLVLGGYVSRRGYLAFLTGFDRYTVLPGYSLATFLSASRQRFALREPRKVTDRLHEERLVANFDIGRPVGNVTPALTLGVSKSRYLSLVDGSRPERFSALRSGASVAFDATDYRLYFDDGLRARVQAAVETPLADGSTGRKPFVTTSVNASTSVGVLSDHVLRFDVLGGLVLGSPRRENVPRLGAGRGFRGIVAQSLWADRHATVSVDYQVPLWHAPFGTVTVAALSDVGRVRNRGGHASTRSHVTWGAGTYVYLKGVALPGLGVEAGHNDPYAKSFVAVSLGVSI